ncbi:MAG: hypothetical protein Kow00121_52850 [Elainellaceae cyanobacterium]
MGMTSTFWDIPGTQSKQLLELLLQLLDPVCVYNKQGRTVYASPRFLDLLQINADQVGFFDYFSIFEKHAVLSRYWQEALQGNTVGFISKLGETEEDLECSLRFNSEAEVMVLICQKSTQALSLCQLAEEYGRLILTLFNHPNLATALVDPEGLAVKCNQKLYDLLGVEERKPIYIEEFVHPEDRLLDAELRQKLLRGEIESYTIEKRYISKTQETIWVNASVSLLEVPIFVNGYNRYFTVLLEDITENKKIYSALVRTEGKWKAFALNSLNLFIQISNTGQIIYISPAVEQVLGYNVEELLDLAVTQLIHPDDLNEFELALHVWSNRIPLHKPGIECRWRTRSSDWAYLYIQGQRFPLALEIDGVALSGYNITDRKQLETQLKVSEAKFRSLVVNIPGAVFRCDSTYTMEFISDEIHSIAGYSATELMNNQRRSYISLIHPDDLPLIKRSMLQSMLDRHPYSVEYRILHANGQIRWVSERRQGVVDHNGNLLWFDGILFDISDRKQTEADLRRSEAINRAMVQALPNLMVQIHRTKQLPNLVTAKNFKSILPSD